MASTRLARGMGALRASLRQGVRSLSPPVLEGDASGRHPSRFDYRRRQTCARKQRVHSRWRENIDRHRVVTQHIQRDSNSECDTDQAYAELSECRPREGEYDQRPNEIKLFLDREGPKMARRQSSVIAL